MNTSFHSKLAEVFSIDIRSLALVRIVLALILLQDVARRAFDITVFYGKGGILPPEYLHTFWNGAWSWSFHLIGGGPTYLVVALFVMQALAAFALLFGFYTRASIVISWLLLVSLHNANPLILQGEDVLLRITLFVAMFLPLGAAFSLDTWFKGTSRETKILSGWSVAYLLQLGFLYFFVSLHKHSPEWVTGNAIYYALSIDQYATPFGKYLLQFPALLSFLTVSVLIFQTVVLFLLFSPFFTVFLRTLSVALLMLMHAGFAASMNLGMFSAVSIAALCGFIPSELWDWLGRRMYSYSVACRVFAERVLGKANSFAVVQRSSVAAGLMSLVGIVYIFYVFFWHIGTVLESDKYVPFAHGFEVPAKVLRLDQRWNLFAPYPYRSDGWIVIAATKTDGGAIDLFRDGNELSLERPDVIYDVYPRPRWRRLFLTLRLENNAHYRVPFAQYMCREWNEERNGTEKIESLDVVYMLEWTPEPGETPPPVRPISLIAWDCNEHKQIPSSLVRN